MDRRHRQACTVIAALALAFSAGAVRSEPPRVAVQPHFAPSTGLAVGVPADVPDGKWYDPSIGLVRDDPLQVDARGLADHAHISVAQARAWLNGQLALEALAERAERLYPELVALRWVDGHPVAQFAGATPPGAI